MANDNHAVSGASPQGRASDRHEKEKIRDFRRDSRQQPTGDAEYRGRHLSIQPGDQLIFEDKGAEKDTSDLITLTNTTSGYVAFKVKTTAPEKFRVKPSFGCIEAGGSRTVEITIQQGYNMTVQRDKFLVMSTSLMEAPKSQNDLIELWHGIFNNESEQENVEEHRLRCQIVPMTGNHLDAGDHLRSGSSSGSSPYPNENIPTIILEKLEAINVKVDRLMALQHESTSASLFAFQWNVFTVGMVIVILYVGIHLIKLILGV